MESIIRYVEEQAEKGKEHLKKVPDELNKINTAREQLVTQIQNLNGVAMYLRGKLPEDAQEQAVDDSVERQDEYPSDE